MKPFKSIDEQIDILKSRNLKISDEANAKRYLHFNNYYNVINCYSKYFLDTHDKYVSETDFKDIEAVHHFDKEIKSVLFKYIIEAEKHFKSVFSYRYCERYRDIPYAYFETIITLLTLQVLPSLFLFSQRLSQDTTTHHMLIR